MQVLSAKKEQNYTVRYLKGLKNQNWEHLVFWCESSSLETGHIDELTRILFPFESTNIIKIKVTRHKVIGDGCIWEGISLMSTCWVSQSVFHQVLKGSQLWWYV